MIVHVLIEFNLPDPSWITRNPAFGEGHQLGAVGGGLRDEVACLVDSCFEVEPDGLGLRHGNVDLGRLWSSHFEYSRVCSML